MLVLEAELVAEQREERRASRTQSVYETAMLDRSADPADLERARPLLTRSGTRSTRAAAHDRRLSDGWRAHRKTPLSPQELYILGTAAPNVTALKKHHECSICHFVKTHPVSCVHIVVFCRYPAKCFHQVSVRSQSLLCMHTHVVGTQLDLPGVCSHH